MRRRTRLSYPAPADPATSVAAGATIEVEEKICKILSKLPGCLVWLVAVRFLQIPAGLNTSIGRATTVE